MLSVMVRVVDRQAGILGSNPGGPNDFPLGITLVFFPNHKLLLLLIVELPSLFIRGTSPQTLSIGWCIIKVQCW